MPVPLFGFQMRGQAVLGLFFSTAIGTVLVYFPVHFLLLSPQHFQIITNRNIHLSQNVQKVNQLTSFIK
jgi:hypothetical protein